MYSPARVKLLVGMWESMVNLHLSESTMSELMKPIQTRARKEMKT
jgi:hypothetical protein